MHWKTKADTTDFVTAPADIHAPNTAYQVSMHTSSQIVRGRGGGRDGHGEQRREGGGRGGKGKQHGHSSTQCLKEPVHGKLTWHTLKEAAPLLSTL